MQPTTIVTPDNVVIDAQEMLLAAFADRGVSFGPPKPWIIYAIRNWAVNLWIDFRPGGEEVPIPPPNPGEIWFCTVAMRGDHLLVAMPERFLSYKFPMKW